MNRLGCVLAVLLSSTAWADGAPVEAAAPIEEAAVVPVPAVVATAPAAVIEAPIAKVTPFLPWQTSRLYVELEVYSQARMTSRAGKDLSELRLDRGELGGRFQLGKQAAAELRFEAIRSAVEGGSLGIDGDSTVFRLKFAQLLGGHDFDHRFRLEGALGFVPDPWIRSLEEDYTVKPLSRTGSERLLLWPTSDLSGLVRFTAGPARATIAIGNGEGPQFPERNTGKTTTAVLEVVPIASEQVRVTLGGVFRDGSIGVASIRDRRYGGGASIVTPYVRGGFEAVIAQGIGDVAEAEGLLTSAWADARVVPRGFLAARGSSLGFDGGGRQSTFGGAIAYEPWRDRDPRQRGIFRVWLAVDRVTSSGAAMPLPGIDAGKATQIMLIASAIAPFTLE